MAEERIDLPCPWCKGEVRHVLGCPSPPLNDPKWDQRKKERAAFDTDCTDDITCPYCGHEIDEPYEYGNVFTEDESRIECPECERTFASYCHVSYSFSTYEVDLEAEKREREEQRRRMQEENKRDMAEAAKWPPGTRVRVRVNSGFAEFLEGREGAVPNKELRHSGFVNVVLRATDKHRQIDTSFLPKDLERI